MITLNIATACLFDARGRLLVVRKRNTSKFMLPGGKREAGESALTALERELWEELLLRMPADALQPLGHFQAVAANEAETWVAADVFIGHLSHEVTAQAELEELMWLDLQAELPDNLAPLLRGQILPSLSRR